MYTDISLYYLDQIGIRPWVRRALSDSKEQSTIKLLIFQSAALETKSQSLVQQMMHYLNLPDSEYAIISLQKEDSPDNYQIKIKQHDPRAVWVLGFEINQDNLSCPVIASLNPDYLIQNPSEKRKAFHELQSIKQLLS